VTIEDALFEKLSTDAGVTAIIGSGSDARIFPMILPQNVEMPAVHFSRVSGERTYTMDGKDPLTLARFQFESYSRKTPEEVKSLSEAIRKALEFFKGMIGTFEIQRIFLESDSDLNNFTQETELFRYTQDFLIHYQET